MPPEVRIRVEVAYALPDRQWLQSCELPEGATLADAIEASGLRRMLPELEVGEGLVGVWNRVRPLDTPLADGDRVEIYRPLRADPKEARRRRARDSR
jgi:putative ubiquitin-RnfH superfamily antitoxin RatB of RatAB toxin-antitoxin module